MTEFKLEQICSLITDGKHGDCEEQNSSGFFFLSCKDIRDGKMNYDSPREITEFDFRETHRRTNLSPGDVLITNSGTIGRLAVAPNHPYTFKTTFQKSVAIIKPKHEIVDSYYLYYYLNYKNRELVEFAGGTTQKNLLLKDIRGFKVKLPTLEKQKDISQKLRLIDEKIELNKQINDTLETMAKAIFKEWFIDFGPVKAKAEGNRPFGMDDETASLFTDTFQDSEIGQIPKGWEVSPISKIADVNKNVLKKTDLLEVIEYIEISSIGNGVVSSSEEYERGTEPSRAKRKIAHGDTVLSTVRPERAAYFLAFEPSHSQIVSTGFAVFSAKHIESWAFLHAVLTRNDFFEELGRLADGGAYPAISPEVISSQKIVLPPSGLIDSFQKITSRFYELKYRLSKENKSLAISRDLLLPKLISGEIDLTGDLK